MRLDYALEGYWLSRRRGFSPHTVADYSVTFRRLAEFVGPDREFEKIATVDLNRFLNHLQEDIGLSPKTVLNAWTALSSLWTWAENETGAQHVMRGKIRRPVYHRPQVEPFTEEEVRKLLAACEHMQAWDRAHAVYVQGERPTAVRDRAMLLMMLDCGLRVSELTGLDVSDYDPKRGAITIRHGKGDKKRVISIANTARQAMWKYLKGRAKPDCGRGHPAPTLRMTATGAEDPLFLSSMTGGRMDRTAVRAIVMRAGARAGVAKAHPHRFRHTFAVNFLRNGGNPLALQDILGHEKLDTVRIYVKLAEMDLVKAQLGASPADRWAL
jgi:site-specific recombinase XerD